MVIDRVALRLPGRTLAVACACSLLLAGCAASPTPQPTTNPPTVAPVFASDEEALAAATEAYANYLDTYDKSWADGDGSLEDFLGLSVGNAHDVDRASYEEWSSKNWRPTGATKFDSMELQAVSQTESRAWQIQTYVCLDVSEGDVVDASGVSVAKPDRPLRLPLEVWFVTKSVSSQDLWISESNVWSGKNFC
jgi:hypothetical protein